MCLFTFSVTPSSPFRVDSTGKSFSERDGEPPRTTRLSEVHSGDSHKRSHKSGPVREEPTGSLLLTHSFTMSRVMFPGRTQITRRPEVSKGPSTLSVQTSSTLPKEVPRDEGGKCPHCRVFGRREY